MGCVDNIKHDQFPAQGREFNKRVRVCFHFDTKHFLCGTVIRDDAEHPFRTLIQLDNGKVIDATECQYLVETLAVEPVPAKPEEELALRFDGKYAYASIPGNGVLSTKGRDEAMLDFMGAVYCLTADSDDKGGYANLDIYTDEGDFLSNHHTGESSWQNIALEKKGGEQK